MDYPKDAVCEHSSKRDLRLGLLLWYCLPAVGPVWARPGLLTPCRTVQVIKPGGRASPRVSHPTLVAIPRELVRVFRPVWEAHYCRCLLMPSSVGPYFFFRMGSISVILNPLWCSFINLNVDHFYVRR